MSFAKFKIAEIGKFESKTPEEFDTTVEAIKLKLDGMKVEPLKVERLR